MVDNRAGPANPYNVWRLGPPVGPSGASAFSSPQPANPHRSLYSHPAPNPRAPHAVSVPPLTTQPGVRLSCRVSSWASVVLAAPHTVSLCRVCPRRPELARPRLASVHAPTWSTTVPQPAKPYNVWRVGPPVGTSGASAFSSPQPANPHRSLYSHPDPQLMRAACTFGATADHAPRCAVVCCRVSSWASVVLAAPHTVSLRRV